MEEASGEGGPRTLDVASVLRTWAAVAPDPAAGSSDLLVCPPEDAIWLGMSVDPGVTDGQRRGTLQQMGLGPLTTDDSVSALPGVPGISRLSRIDAMHGEEPLLTVAWVVLSGTIQRGGDRARVLQPLLTRSASVRRQSILTRGANASFGGPQAEHVMTARGESVLSPLIADPATRMSLTESAEFGGGALTPHPPPTDALLRRLKLLRDWISKVTRAMGLPTVRMTVEANPLDLVDHKGVVACVGTMLFLHRNPNQPSARAALEGWASMSGIDRTALGAVLGHPPTLAPRDAADAEEPVRVPMPLSPAQEQVVRTARTSAVTALSGAPGTGKTHTLGAVALDHVGRRHGVLIATHSRAAADAVTDLLERTPGPDPVRFGDGTRIAKLLDDLEQRRADPVTDGGLDALRAARDRAEARDATLRTAIGLQLAQERSAESAAGWDTTVAALMALAPAWFEPDADHAAAAAAIGEAAEPPGMFGWSRRRNGRRALERARSLAGAASRAGTGAAAGAGAESSLDQLRMALEAAVSRRSAAHLSSTGGTALDRSWRDLISADRDRRTAIGRHLEGLASQAVRGRAGRDALSGLVTALRAGRGARRQMLAELPAAELTQATPLWIGTLGDVEDVLPRLPGLFDLVILDEASHIDAPRAAGALLRARRALVVGDPRQLRFTSFLSDDAMADAARRYGLGDDLAWIDARRTCAFDLAVRAGEPLALRQHFRSAPHLIGYSMREFYRDDVAIMTTSPATEAMDCIDEVLVPASAPSGADPEADLATEVDAVVATIARLAADGTTDIGVITPFRDHATRIEAALAARFDSEEIRRMRLRAATVHGFQGAERDVMVIAPGISPAHPAGRLRFAEEDHLFNVMVTRARARVVVVTTLADPGRGNLGRYLAWGERGPVPPVTGGAEGWVEELAGRLAATGLRVRTNYPVGPWRIDIVVGDGDAALAVEASVHPEGPGPHIARRLTLASLGWRLTDAFPTRWDGDAARAAVELSGRALVEAPHR